MAHRHKDRELNGRPPPLPPENAMDEVPKRRELDLRPGHREQTRETRGPRFGYWQVGGASRSAIKRLKKP